MRSAILAILMAWTGTLFLHAAEPQAIHWHDKFPQAEQRKSKPMLLYFTTKGCGYCIKMKSSTFADRNVVQRVQENFLPIELDGRKHPAVAKNLRIRIYPSTAIIHPSGTVVDIIPGFVTPEDFLNRLGAAQKQINHHTARIAKARRAAGLK